MSKQIEFYNQEKFFFETLVPSLQEGVTTKQLQYYIDEGFLHKENDNWDPDDLSGAQINLMSHEDLSQQVEEAFSR